MVRKDRRVKEYLFVDGYNIINAWDSLKKFREDNIKEARDEFIEIMAEYKHYSGIEVIIVFDAYLVKGNWGNEEIYKGIKIVYTKENETADQYIERTLDKIGRIKRVRVATSDWVEQQIILGRGGTRVSARELEVEIINEKKTIKRKRLTENRKNDMILGRLDEDVIEKLNSWISKKENLD